MTPQHGAQIALIGAASFNAISASYLQTLAYGSTPIPANNDSSNKLPTGTVFAVRTTAGNYAKVLVTSYGYNMGIRWVTYRLRSPYRVLGTGYNRPEDLALTADGDFAYVTERTGTLLRVDLSNANRAAATVVASGMTAPHQIALDEERQVAHVVEFAPSGRLIRINLATGAKTTVAGGIERGIGLLLTDDQRFAYVSQQAAAGGKVTRIDLATGVETEIASGLTNPFFMRWSDAGESGILLPERDPANRLVRIDLTRATPQVTRIATGLPARPSSAALPTASKVLVCSDDAISELDYLAAVFGPAGPLLMGIGHVPHDRISQGGLKATRGYATTDPGYFFRVVDAPFGGSLPIKFNHAKAYAAGARYFRLTVTHDVPGGATVEPRHEGRAYRWSTSQSRWILRPIAPTAGRYYRINRPGEVWYDHWLGYWLHTGSLPNGLHRIAVTTYTARPGTQVDTDSLLVRIDNGRATAVIDALIHVHSGSQHLIDTCAIVDHGPDAFRFRITAWDPEGHLKSYSLRALWGDNKSKNVTSRTYTPVASKKWSGPSAQLVPSSTWSAAVPSDPTSTRCAHTFRLSVWDRVINGHNHIHHTVYHKSITLMLPP